jgi:uncharacterized protein YlxW (UPF0749 family)
MLLRSDGGCSVPDEEIRRPADASAAERPSDESSAEPSRDAAAAVDEEEPAGEPAADRPRPRRQKQVAFGVVIALLTALLGFAIVLQVRQNSSTDNLANLREDDLVGILDNQNARADRLRQQIAELQQTLRRLKDSGDRSAAARQQAEQDAQALGILLGTLPAAGPGVIVTVTDPGGKLGAEDLLDLVEELRGAGAEAIQFGPVRVSTTTAFTDAGAGRVAVDGTAIPAPYRVLAIGDPKTLDTALNIPGGVAAAIRTAGADLTVMEQSNVNISATRSLPTPKYASPSGR